MQPAPERDQMKLADQVIDPSENEASPIKKKRFMG